MARVKGNKPGGLTKWRAGLLFVGVFIISQIPVGGGVLRVDPTNPRYFNDGTKPVFLTGSHTWLNLNDFSRFPPFDYNAYLDLLTAKNHNFIRLWMAKKSYGKLIDPALGYFTPIPFPRVSGHGNSADGGLKFDLSLFDQSWFNRMRARVIAAGSRGIYVDIVLFNGWWIDGGTSADQTTEWNNHYFNPANNINGYSMVRTDTYTMNNTAWVALMDAYARKVVDTVNDLDNVLYEVGNEIPVSSKNWQYHMINLIKTYEAGKPKQHPMGITAFSYPSGAEANNTYLYSSPADWIALSGPVNYTTNIPDANPSKVDILDTDHTWGLDPPGDDSPWVWKSFVRGHNPIYMDPDGYVAANPPDTGIRDAMGYARTLANRIDLAHMVPSDSTTSTRYALVNANTEYLIYQPANSSFTVNLPAKSFNFEWVNPATGSITSSGTFSAIAGNKTFSLPGGYNKGALLHLKSTATPTPTPTATPIVPTPMAPQNLHLTAP